MEENELVLFFKLVLDFFSSSALIYFNIFVCILFDYSAIKKSKVKI